jgi:hypothetical protein
MNLDAARRRRQTLREMLLARSTALSNTTARGASSEGGSTLPGLYGQASGEGNTALAGIEQNRQLGSDIFDANAKIARAQGNSAMGGAIQSVGGMLIQNRQEISSVGQYLGG